MAWQRSRVSTSNSMDSSSFFLSFFLLSWYICVAHESMILCKLILFFQLARGRSRAEQRCHVAHVFLPRWALHPVNTHQTAVRSRRQQAGAVQRLAPARAQHPYFWQPRAGGQLGALTRFLSHLAIFFVRCTGPLCLAKEDESQEGAERCI